MKQKIHDWRLFPGRLALISILTLIAIGSFLLALPVAQLKPLSIIDVVFTAASATSITGLMTIPIDSFSQFGQWIILGLMQIGGLGLVTLTIFSISLFVNLGLGTQLVAGEILEVGSWQKTRNRLAFIIALTLFAELIGCIGFYFVFRAHFPALRALFVALFHAVSSFCNVGLTLFDKNLIPFQNNIFLLIMTGILVFSGGFGFVTWHEVMQYVRARMKQKTFLFSLTTRVTIWSNALLLMTAIILLFLLEKHGAFYGMPLLTRITNVLFDAVSFRSTGFTTINISQAHYATLFVIMLFAFIGSSAGSTGSGVKQSTFAIFFATIRAGISGRSSVQLLGRTITKDQTYKAIAIVGLSLLWIFVSTLLLLLSETGKEFIEIFFEAASAFANVGLSTGITPQLNTVSKIILIVSMIAGRIGSFTLMLALMRKSHRRELQYPEEQIALS